MNLTSKAAFSAEYNRYLPKLMSCMRMWVSHGVSYTFNTQILFFYSFFDRGIRKSDIVKYQTGEISDRNTVRWYIAMYWTYKNNILHINHFFNVHLSFFKAILWSQLIKWLIIIKQSQERLILFTLYVPFICGRNKYIRYW